MKRRTDTHDVLINSHTCGCTCRRWTGPTRHDNETQGAFTLRAKAEHEAHVARLQSQGEMFTALTGLFLEEARS